jgi:hypothetical protein
VATQNPDAERAEGGDFWLFGEFLSQQQGRSFLHFLGRLIGEGNRKDAIGRYAVTDQLRNPERNHPSLASTSPRQDQQWTGKCINGFSLRRIEVHGIDGKAGIHSVKGGRRSRHTACAVRRFFSGAAEK